MAVVSLPVCLHTLSPSLQFLFLPVLSHPSLFTMQKADYFRDDFQFPQSVCVCNEETRKKLYDLKGKKLHLFLSGVVRSILNLLNWLIWISLTFFSILHFIITTLNLNFYLFIHILLFCLFSQKKSKIDPVSKDCHLLLRGTGSVHKKESTLA